MIRKLTYPARHRGCVVDVHPQSLAQSPLRYRAADVDSSRASDYPHFGVLDEASLFDLFDELWET